MKDLKKVTIVGGWKRCGEHESDITPHEIKLEGHIEPEEAIQKCQGEIEGYTTVTHTVEDRTFSFDREEADKIRKNK